MENKPIEFTQENFNKLVVVNKELVKGLEHVVNSACHPDIAIRVLMVELAPVRKALKKNKELYGEVS